MIMKKTAKTPDKRIVIADAFQQLMNSNPADKITVKPINDWNMIRHQSSISSIPDMSLSIVIE